jgi:ankyrin repeat protein
MAQSPPSYTLGTELQAMEVVGLDADLEPPPFSTCSSPHMYGIRLLLAHGADVTARVGHFGTALQGGCLYGNYHAVRLLLNKGADVYLKDGAFRSALHAACSRSDSANTKVVYLLLQAGADVDARVRRSRDHLSALEIVICSLDIGKIRMMLPHSKKSERNRELLSCVRRRICAGRTSILRNGRTWIFHNLHDDTHSNALLVFIPLLDKWLASGQEKTVEDVTTEFSDEFNEEDEVLSAEGNINAA